MEKNIRLRDKALFRILPLQLKYPFHFRKVMGRWPRLLSPKDYSDFIARDCFFGRHNKHAYLADKYEVRKYVEKKGLSDILIPLLGVWDKAEDINFDTLPDQFALKCNHSCAMNIICYDKKKLDIEKTVKQLNVWLKTKHDVYFEQHYNQIKPRIICEAIIPSNEEGVFPMDYKIHCANGKPVFIQCCIERSNNSVGKRVVYSTEWKKLPYTNHDYHYTDTDIPKPQCLNRMLEVASILSAGLDYARIDLYEVGGKIIFGEVTLTPMGGWLSFFSQEALDLMGNEIIKGKNR